HPHLRSTLFPYTTLFRSAVETVEDGVTGVFFDQPNSLALAAAIEKFEGMSWDQHTLRRHAEQFDQAVFSFRILQFLGSVAPSSRSEEHTSELQSRSDLVC